MSVENTPADDVKIDLTLARRLLRAQFPQWSNLPLRPVPSGGTDNMLFRLGDTLVVRLPREDVPGRMEKECGWLPRLAPRLPLPVPLPLAKGTPAEGYPRTWSICQWLEGETARLGGITSPAQASALGRWIAALQEIDPSGGPLPGPHNSNRGVSLARRDRATRAAIAELRGLNLIDADLSARIWAAALSAPAWDRPPVWIHGDLQPGNLLMTDGRVSAVIDFGCLGIGDPACDVMAAWTCLPAETRRFFRQALAVDDATWARGRGWALSFGLIALPYYHQTNRILAGIARHAIEEVLADVADGA